MWLTATGVCVAQPEVVCGSLEEVCVAHSKRWCVWLTARGVRASARRGVRGGGGRGSSNLLRDILSAYPRPRGSLCVERFLPPLSRSFAVSHCQS